jgi:hypothetical protein
MKLEATWKRQRLTTDIGNAAKPVSEKSEQPYKATA